MITLYTRDYAIVQPKGQLDLLAGVELQQALGGICPEHHACWVIDLTHIEFINSAGLTALIQGLTLASEKQCALKLHNPNPSVKLVFEITRLDELFEIVEAIELEDAMTNGSKGFAPDLDRDGAPFIASAA